MRNSKELHPLFREIYNYFKLPISVVSKDGRCSFCIPDISSEIVPARILSALIDSLDPTRLNCRVPYIKSTPYDSYLGIIPLPTHDYLVVGPAFTSPFSKSRVIKFKKEYVTNEELNVLEKATSPSPIVDEKYFAEVLSSIIMVLYYTRIEPTIILSRNQIAPDKKTYYDAANIIESDYKTLLLFESNVSSAVQSGNLTELTKLWEEFRLHIQDRHEEYMYYEHHLMIPLLSSARLAALKTRAPQEEIIQIFHSCISRIAAGESFSINSKIIEQGTYDLCNLVKKSQNFQFRSDICITCENYIDDHISEKITAADIARHCGVDRSLIFDIFRKNYNLSLTDYIQKTRIRRAKVLLIHSRASIAEIATSLGFGSASYFSKVFSSFCGCTPKEYKKNHQNN